LVYWLPAKKFAVLEQSGSISDRGRYHILICFTKMSARTGATRSIRQKGIAGFPVDRPEEMLIAFE